ncbi:MAG TPA: MoaD/ThiS family protein [Elusimicrobiota bacterium]|nr:MoaD/ThiS family protein [Elusimicrobiota bacterium]
MALVRIPSPLRHLTRKQSVVSASGGTVEEVFAALEKSCPGVREKIIDETGQVRRFINVTLNGEDIKLKDGVKTPVSENDELRVVPAIAGG